MIVIESFLRDRDGTMVPVAQAAPPPDPRHIEGAIRLVIDHVPILDESLWDDVDQLWAYLTDMLDPLAATGEASTYFPDMPVKVTFSRLGSGPRVRVSVTNIDKPRTAVTTETELLKAIRRAGAHFFAEMTRLDPAGADTYQPYQDKLA